MKAELGRGLGGQRLLGGFIVTLVIELLWFRVFETGAKLHLVENSNREEHFEVNVRSPSVPCIRNMPPVENFSKEVTQVVPWHSGRPFPMVRVDAVQVRFVYRGANLQVACIEAVFAAPSLHTESAPAENNGVEPGQGIQ